MNYKGILAIAALSGMALPAAAQCCGAKPIVETEAYRWVADSILQGPYKAYAVSPDEIRSDYSARPGYYMGIDKVWKRKNDISAYPRLKTDNKLHTAIYNMALDEMINAVEPDTTLRTGKEWAGVWTRDVSYSIILSMAQLQPEASKISLRKKVNPSGQIIQDTGSGGAWPISTDRMVWVLAAWEIYKATGDKAWLQEVYPVAEKSIAKDAATVMGENGLVKGETSFIDWREQSYPRWMQTMDISQSQAMGTNVMYAAALKAFSEMSAVLGKKKVAEEYATLSARMAEAIEREFTLEDGTWAMYNYGRDSKALNPRTETLGYALAILYDIASPERAKALSQKNPQTPFGASIFYPQIADMPNYHNNALWPFVASYWTLAQAKAGNEQGVMEGIGSIYRPAALFCTNKENFNLDNGDIYTELNSSNMLWCLSGNLSLTNRLLFGLHYEKDGLRIAPFVPQAMAGTRTLENVDYRGAKIDITVEGYGAHVKSLTLNGKALKPDAVITPKQLAKGGVIKVVMDNTPIPAMALNRTGNKKAPWTPSARLEYCPAQPDNSRHANLLSWQPIEYMASYDVYFNGKKVGNTRQTTWPATQQGEWQVAAVAGDGTRGFLSEPLSNRDRIVAQYDNETSRLASYEVSYQPEGGVEGAHGGFVETDRTLAPRTVTVTVPAAGEYTVAFRYANGNGPVNTENKAAVRTLLVDGQKVGTIVMPQRGVANWSDWGMTNTVRIPLTAGEHTFTLEYRNEDENMNINTNHALIDEIHVEKI